MYSTPACCHRCAGHVVVARHQPSCGGVSSIFAAHERDVDGQQVIEDTVRQCLANASWQEASSLSRPLEWYAQSGFGSVRMRSFKALRGTLAHQVFSVSKVAATSNRMSIVEARRTGCRSSPWPTKFPFLMMGIATVFAFVRGSLALHRDEQRRCLLTADQVPPTLWSVP